MGRQAVLLCALEGERAGAGGVGAGQMDRFAAGHCQSAAGERLLTPLGRIEQASSNGTGEIWASPGSPSMIHRLVP